MMKKIFFTLFILLSLAGCSSHPTTMQDVSSFCRSLSTEEFCENQDNVCAEYSEIMIAPYKSAKECRMSCENVLMKRDSNMQQQDCLQLLQSVEAKCNEFCDSNYAD
ncbi:lipoprotein [Maridesulfovibrio sp.]|uniref:lipoprotein n=1 Tax=Maridesulfovibrio sp. TaxID=2795000 RepID=UPI0029CA4A7C|nr:lipoprotein [Maridesulfovibrio sp.]